MVGSFFNHLQHCPYLIQIEDDIREGILNSSLIAKLKEIIVYGGVKIDNVIEALAKFCTHWKFLPVSLSPKLFGRIDFRHVALHKQGQE